MKHPTVIHVEEKKKLDTFGSQNMLLYDLIVVALLVQKRQEFIGPAVWLGPFRDDDVPLPQLIQEIVHQSVPLRVFTPLSLTPS